MELNKGLDLEDNQLNNLGIVTEPDIPEPTEPQQAPQDYKELCQLELSNGQKIMLGSCCRPVEMLCELALQMKGRLENKPQNKGANYTG